MSDTFEEIVARNKAAPPDRRPDGSGLDDGPWLPGQAPRQKPQPKSAEDITEIRSRAWTTRREKYGSDGHR